MKRVLLIISVGLTILAAALTGPAYAFPIGNSNQGREYFSGSAWFDRWSFGLYSRTQTREVRVLVPEVAKTRRSLMWLGYDAYQWMTVYGGIGHSEVKFFDTYEDGENLFAFGLHFNLIDYDIMDPVLMEDRLRLNVDMRFTKTKTPHRFETLNWREFYMNATISIVNDCDGSKLFFPDSIALFAGPVYSDLSAGLQEEDRFGITLGMEMFVNEKVSLALAVENFERSGYTGGVSVRF